MEAEGWRLGSEAPAVKAHPKTEHRKPKTAPANCTDYACFAGFRCCRQGEGRRNQQFPDRCLVEDSLCERLAGDGILLR